MNQQRFGWLRARPAAVSTKGPHPWAARQTRQAQGTDRSAIYEMHTPLPPPRLHIPHRGAQIGCVRACVRARAGSDTGLLLPLTCSTDSQRVHVSMRTPSVLVTGGREGEGEDATSSSQPKSQKRTFRFQTGTYVRIANLLYASFQAFIHEALHGIVKWHL